jgi:hypothetical protein
MKKVLLLWLCVPAYLCAQQSQQLLVVWDERIWQLPMIQKKYPEWPQTSGWQINLVP